MTCRKSRNTSVKNARTTALNVGPIKQPTVFENDDDLPSDRKHLQEYFSQEAEVKPNESPDMKMLKKLDEQIIEAETANKMDIRY